MAKDKKWRIHEICKTCAYRETIGWTVNVMNDWSNTCCTYMLETDCIPNRKKLTDTYCPYYIKCKKRRPKKYDAAIERMKNK